MNKFYSSWFFQVVLGVNGVFFLFVAPMLIVLYVGLFVSLKISFFGALHRFAMDIFLTITKSNLYVKALIIIFNFPFKYLDRSIIVRRKFSRKSISGFEVAYNIYFMLLILCVICSILVDSLVYLPGEYPNR